MVTVASIRDDAARLFPNWTGAQRERWVTAKLRSFGCTPHFGKLLPLTLEAAHRPAAPFAPRTLREAGL